MLEGIIEHKIVREGRGGGGGLFAIIVISMGSKVSYLLFS